MNGRLRLIRWGQTGKSAHLVAFHLPDGKAIPACSHKTRLPTTTRRRALPCATGVLRRRGSTWRHSASTRQGGSSGQDRHVRRG
jgi:hypothetical protein